MPILQCYIDNETYKRLKAIEQAEGIGYDRVAESLISEGVLNHIKRDDRYKHLLKDQ